MSQSATVLADLVIADRWEAVRWQACPVGKRMIDVNHGRREVRWRCDACRETHTLHVGAPE